MAQRMLCPHCGVPMWYAGFAISGSREVQQYRCGNKKCDHYLHRYMNSKEGYIRKENK